MYVIHLTCTNTESCFLLMWSKLLLSFFNRFYPIIALIDSHYMNCLFKMYLTHHSVPVVLYICQDYTLRIKNKLKHDKQWSQLIMVP